MVESELRKSAASILPPWRDQSPWRITTTKTVEGLSGQPKYGAKQHCEGLLKKHAHEYDKLMREGAQQHYEALLKKHAIEYTKLMKEYEDRKAKEQEMKPTGAEKKAEFDEKENDWKEMVEEIIFNLAKVMAGRARGSGPKDGKSVEERQKEEEASAPKEDQGKFIAQLLDFSRKRAKTQETAEQPFPDCKWEEMEDGEGTKKKKAKRKDGQGLNDKRRREKEEASQVRQEKKPQQKQV